MKIKIKKSPVIGFENAQEDIGNIKTAVNEEYVVIDALKKLCDEFETLGPKEFLKLFLIVYDVEFKRRDLINLAQKVTGIKTVGLKPLNFVKRYNRNDCTYFEGQVMCAQSFKVRRNLGYSLEDIKDLIARKKIILYNFHVIIGSSSDYKKDAYKDLVQYHNLPLTYENYEMYASELVSLIKAELSVEDMRRDLITLIDGAREDTEKLKALMDKQIGEYHAEATSWIIKADKETAEWETYQERSISLKRELDAMKKKE